VPVAADLLERASLTRALGALGGAPFDALVYAAAADRSSEEAYRAAYVDGLRNALDAIGACGHPPRRVLFTSSTAVYAQQAGEWIDEESPTEPRHFNGLRMLEAERVLLGSGLRATALRLGGIYGPGRTRLVESVRRGRAPARPGRYTNRIHRDDAAGALRHLLGLALAGEPLAPLYVGVDDEPADEATVVEWLAARLGVPAPVVSTAQPSNKRCCNARLRATGYRFRYPSFREGYGALLTSPGS
jgi:nucleoside-diphosphate-sugar epimerase